MRFRDRVDAGRVLAGSLQEYRGRDDLVVLALPRGGVPVGFELARRLEAPLDVFLVRKLGVPGHEELAMGAIASGGVRVVNDAVVAELGLTDDDIARVATTEGRELDRREHLYREGRTPIDVRDRTVILVDDGLATGASMRAAVQAVRALHPDRVVVAVPVAAESACVELRAEVDEIVCALTPEPFLSIGSWYEDFSQTSDDEVRGLLAQSAPAEARR
jgi:predicted phosphoribosyltransferase